MYHITHDLTHYTWETTSKDSMLHEFDLMNERAKCRDLLDNVTVIERNHQQDTLNQLTFVMPYDGNIDELFSVFGESELEVIEPEKKGVMLFVDKMKQATKRLPKIKLPKIKLPGKKVEK